MKLLEQFALALIGIFTLSTNLQASEVKTIYSTPEKNNKSLVRSIYTMPEGRGRDLVEQCTRSVYYPDSFWRVTFEQVDAIEDLLANHIKKMRLNQVDGFIPNSLEQYKRQYVGFEMEGKSYFYGNFFPREYDLEVDPLREAVVICRGDQRFWGMLFNIESYEFEAIERNDKLVKMKGPVNPFLESQPDDDAEDNSSEDSNF